MKKSLSLKLLFLALLTLPATLHADHVMIAGNWIVSRDTIEVEAGEYKGKLVLNLHFASSPHAVCLRILYKEDHDSPKAKAGFRKFLEILRDPNTSSISDPELGPKLALTFDRFLNPNE